MNQMEPRESTNQMNQQVTKSVSCETTLKLLDHVQEALLFLDGSKIAYANKKAKEFFGECEGSDLFELLILEKGTLLVDSIHSDSLQGNLEFEDKVFSGKKGGWIHFHITYVKQLSAIILRDITQERILQEAKDNMSVLVAHELKNPLSVLLSTISEMIEDEDDEENLRKLLTVEKQALRLRRIVEQIEYITMAQLGLYTPKPVFINVKRLLDSVLDDIIELAQKKSITIEKQISIDNIVADEFIIRTILRNLISNAVKYSFENSRVIVKITQDYISVRDFGVGIPDEDIPKIFNRFYRTSTAVKMASGSGLGLAVVKHLANIADYRIEVKSQRMIGTEFIVYLR
ncbi:two-component system, OmpR family, sensor kinase [Fervidobacterium changbaicum]|nr:two-component system, OmpR family, sensor kinase [Fervidobacterium changbaicum]